MRVRLHLPEVLIQRNDNEPTEINFEPLSVGKNRRARRMIMGKSLATVLAQAGPNVGRNVGEDRLSTGPGGTPRPRYLRPSGPA